VGAPNVPSRTPTRFIGVLFRGTQRGSELKAGLPYFGSRCERHGQLSVSDTFDGWQFVRALRIASGARVRLRRTRTARLLHVPNRIEQPEVRTYLTRSVRGKAAARGDERIRFSRNSVILKANP
jgi:hypothetical protein